MRVDHVATAAAHGQRAGSKHRRRTAAIHGGRCRGCVLWCAALPVRPTSPTALFWGEFSRLGQQRQSTRPPATPANARADFRADGFAHGTANTVPDGTANGCPNKAAYGTANTVPNIVPHSVPGEADVNDNSNASMQRRC